MNTPNKVKEIKARELLDSRGFPTVEVEMILEGGAQGRALVPSGASTGEGEALELRDGDKKRYQGKGVLKAVANVRELLAPKVIAKTWASQADLDRAMCEWDGTPNKSKYGANAILGVSMAYMRAVSAAKSEPTLKTIQSIYGGEGRTLPMPLMNILNGGKHADNGLAIQEFMIVPKGFTKFSEALRAGCEVFHALKKILHDKGLATGVGDEGGFAPVFSGDRPHEQALLAILDAVSAAGYHAGRDIFLALDCAASEFAKGDFKTGQGVYHFEGSTRTSKEMANLYSQWAGKYPIISIEDGLSEHDWTGWADLTRELGSRVQLVGDDLFVTNKAVLKEGIERKAANAILIKLNQIGTVSETLETMKLAKEHRFNSIASHRSGETEDTFIADLAVGTECGQIKTGSASRTDRIAKYNQLLRIEEWLGKDARYGSKATS